MEKSDVIGAEGLSFEYEGTTYSITESEFWELFAGRIPRTKDDLPLFEGAVAKAARRIVQEKVKSYKKGEFMHVSKLSPIAWINLIMESKKYGSIPKQKGVTYIKKK